MLVVWKLMNAMSYHQQQVHKLMLQVLCWILGMEWICFLNFPQLARFSIRSRHIPLSLLLVEVSSFCPLFMRLRGEQRWQRRISFVQVTDMQWLLFTKFAKTWCNLLLRSVYVLEDLDNDFLDNVSTWMLSLFFFLIILVKWSKKKQYLTKVYEISPWNYKKV